MILRISFYLSLILATSLSPLRTLGGVRETIPFCIAQYIASPDLQEGAQPEGSNLTEAKLRLKALQDRLSETDAENRPSINSTYISQSGRVKSEWTTTTTLAKVSPKRREFGWVYGPPYFHQGKWWIDYRPNGSKSRILKRMSYDKYLNSGLAGFKKIVDDGNVVIFPDPESPKGAPEQRFLLAKASPLGGNQVLLETPSGRKFQSNYKDLFFWNGFSTANHDSLFSFFTAGGNGKLFRLNLPDNPGYDGQYILVAEHLPAVSTLRRSFPGLSSGISYDALRGAQARGARLALMSNPGGAMLPEKNALLGKINAFDPPTTPANVGLIIGTRAPPGVVDHELKHLDDRVTPPGGKSTMSKVYDELNYLAAQKFLTSPETTVIARAISEQRAYAEELAATKCTLSDSAYEEKIHEVTREFENLYGQPAARIFDRYRKTNPENYQVLRNLVSKYFTKNEHIGLSQTFPGHF